MGREVKCIDVLSVVNHEATGLTSIMKHQDPDSQGHGIQEEQNKCSIPCP